MPVGVGDGNVVGCDGGLDVRTFAGPLEPSAPAPPPAAAVGEIEVRVDVGEVVREEEPLDVGIVVVVVVAREAGRLAVAARMWLL
mmetsp:Transcript_95236/g.308421  ORF Transcript_95236/g.308421 Transcript_95236/m.308421 type:complete len:85 (-) Transcript_95236:1915-2169(-)